MRADGRSRIGWSRGLLVVAAIAGLSDFGLSYFDGPGPQRAQPQRQDRYVVAARSERPQLGPSIAHSVVASSSGALTNEGTSRPHDRPGYVPGSSWQPPSVPFKFLGTVTDEGQTVVLLHRGGQTLTVRGTGSIDDDYDDYVVDAFEAAYLVLRRVADGESQIIQLMSVAPVVEMAASAESTPQD